MKGQNDMNQLNNLDLYSFFLKNEDESNLLSELQLEDNYVNIDGKIKLQINFKNESNNPDPNFATSGSSGVDLRANLESLSFGGSVLVPSYKLVMIPTGIYVQIPENFEMQIRPRSGLAAKFGITVLNTPGTIDSDYRGEIVIILYNTGAIGDFVVNHGDRIAQGVVVPVIGANSVFFKKVNELNETKRNSGGFGHTGVK